MKKQLQPQTKHCGRPTNCPQDQLCKLQVDFICPLKIQGQTHQVATSLETIQVLPLFSQRCFTHAHCAWYNLHIKLDSRLYYQRLWECVRFRKNVYPATLNDFPSWLSTSKNQPCFINNRGFTERYFSDKVHASLIDWWLRCVTAPVSVDSHV